MTPNDDKLAMLAHQFDNYIMMMVDEHKVDPLSACAIMLARLTLTCDYMGCGDNFRKLLVEASQHQAQTQETLQ